MKLGIRGKLLAAFGGVLLTGGIGTLIIVGGFLATTVGYALARRSARLSRPPRLFA